MSRLPRVGLSAGFFHADPARAIFKGKTLLYLDEAMSRWVASGGAFAYLVPTAGPTGPTVGDLAADLDGLVLQAGSDVCPRSYGEEPMRPEWEGDVVRDRYEIDLVRAFVDAGKPVLGICRGHQVVNVAFGGTLYQDITTQVDAALVHRDWEPYDANRHTIDVLPGTGLAKLYPGTERAVVNSVHHQSIKDLGRGLTVEAVSVDDGIVEAVRLDDGDTFVVGVQWHPEWMPPPRAEVDTEVDAGNPPLLSSTPILDEFVDRAREVANR
jgi:putative glutamine amidotransferase